MRAAILALAGALALAIPAARADPHGHDHDGGRGGPHGGYEHGSEGGPRGGYERGPREGPERGPRDAYDAGQGRGYEGPPPRWARGEEERGGRGGAERWDDRRFNGYWLGSRWYFGAPPGEAFREPGFRPGFAPWRRGAYLPPSYQGFVVDEYWRYHLRRPPFGYHWVQVGDDLLLVSVSSGVIFDIIAGE